MLQSKFFNYFDMGDTSSPTHVDHPLWSRFLRWCTIRPKSLENPSNDNLVTVVAHNRSVRVEPLNDYQHTPLPDPQSYIRLVTLLPGKFDEEIRVSIHHEALRPPSGSRQPRRMTLTEVRKDLPSGWEAFQTVSRRRTFRTAHLRYSQRGMRLHRCGLKLTLVDHRTQISVSKPQVGHRPMAASGPELSCRKVPSSTKGRWSCTEVRDRFLCMGR